ncbi:hypothetical protein C5167_040369 [Papaver somniferum]|uniref:non-specific serine/threonine protein kinase n=1 Tax=Papaver somniferum TaxID=3469 RepID=A0A4Y7IES0_PAPSO|nr:serine/threonine-protein kinase OXI1-like [Papaver somniferum]RZC47423.1 hypothetical protein C5167_040369 [Papaver somniferum]
MMQENQEIDLQNLKALSVLGRGAKGVVFQVQEQQQTLALKVISKSFIQNKSKNKKNQEEKGVSSSETATEEDIYRRIWFERDVLKLFDHPLLPKLKGVIVTEEIVGFAIDYCNGGDLSSLRKKQSEKMFSDDIIRFFAAELVIALEYLHGLGIVYRDLKPENIMVQENGHLMLVDFDLSTKISMKSEDFQSRSPINNSISSKEMKKKKKRFPVLNFCSAGIGSDESDRHPEARVNSVRSDSEKSNSFVGTEEYVAPEIISGNGHDFSVDWWGLGVVLYEMLYGKTPFRGVNRQETFFRILTLTPPLVGEKTALRDFIGKLLEKDPTKRICLQEIKNHEFFQGLDWEKILQISRPPFIPSPNLVEENGVDEDMKVINGIDVKTFVHIVFNGCDEVVVEKDEMKKRKDHWVEGLSNPTTNNKNEDFFVF